MVEPSLYDRQATVDAALRHLPARMRPTLDRLLAQWPGRILWGTASAFVRVELFDRSMAIAAQFFTAVFPTVIMLGSLFDGVQKQITQDISLPAKSKQLLEDAFNQQSSTAFGIVGALIVLASATSLSRALTRAYAATWMLPRPQTKLRSAWRWLAVVLMFALAVVMVPLLKRFASDLPPATFWQAVLGMVLDTSLAVLVPWILLSGRISLRLLAPSGLLFALVMVFVRPASAIWLPRALNASADRYGTFGVAFTYLAWLYVVSWCLLATAAIGHTITTDPGWFGQLLRGERRTSGSAAPTAQGDGITRAG